MVWPKHIRRIDPIGQLTRYLCKCFIFTVYRFQYSSRLTIVTFMLSFWCICPIIITIITLMQSSYVSVTKLCYHNASKLA